MDSSHQTGHHHLGQWWCVLTALHGALRFFFFSPECIYSCLTYIESHLVDFLVFICNCGITIHLGYLMDEGRTKETSLSAARGVRSHLDLLSSLFVIPKSTEWSCHIPMVHFRRNDSSLGPGRKVISTFPNSQLIFNLTYLRLRIEPRTLHRH